MEEIKNPKLQQIFSTAKSLFMRYGIKRVSIEEICREANVSKMTFYKNFRNKVDLLKFILEKMISESIARYNEIMNQEISFPEKVKQSIRLKMEKTDDLSQEFLNDLLKNADPEIMDFYNQKAQENIQLMLKDYLEAQKQGDIREDIKPEFIYYILNHMIELIHDERLEKLYDSPQKLIMELTNFFFYGILPRNEHDDKRDKV